MRREAVAFCIVVSVVATAALAESTRTLAFSSTKTGSLMQACDAALKNQSGVPLTDDESFLSAMCGGYVAGFIDGHEAAVLMSDSPQPQFCIPTEVLRSPEIVRRFRRALGSSGGDTDDYAATSALAALHREFPCSRR